MGGRVIVITGASSGIGRCTASLFGRKGWRVGLIARGAAGLAAIEAELAGAGAMVASAVADVADDGALREAAATLQARLGPADVWVNCAGNGVFGRFTEVPAAEFDRVTAVTYTGTVNGTRAALRSMVPRGEGLVVNICSAVAFHGLPMLSSYAGAKHAVRGFAEAVRHELVGDGSRVRITTVFPPAVNTPFFSHAVSYLPLPPRPAKPVYQPEVVADAVLLATKVRWREIKVSGVTVVFALACKLVPGVIQLCMQKLGAEGQMTDLPEAVRLREPTLFAPSGRAWGAHGPFDGEARGWSAQMWVMRRLGWLLVAGLGVATAALMWLAW